jgi:hypothetical protein
MTQFFTLVPFDPCPLGLALNGTVDYTARQLSITYHLQGDLTTLTLPSPHHDPQRCDRLWESTCFEAFFGRPQNDDYWELNLSPSGAWNLYHLTNYRAGMSPETRIALPVSQSDRQDQSFLLTVTLDLAHLLPAGQPLNLGITTVLQTQSGTCSYWALKHPAPIADFHNRQGFAIALQPA